MPAFATPGPIAATVVVAGAQVRVTASDRTDTVVLVEPIDQASQSDVKVASKTKVDFADGQLSVKTTSPGTRTVRSPSRSTCPPAPAWSRTWRTRMSTLTAHWASASCTWHRARSSSIASTRCRPTSRPARSRSATSPGAPPSTAARSHADQRGRGHRQLSSSGGQIWIGHASADLDLSSASGGFDIDRADGSVTAKTAHGAIRIGRLTRGQAELMNGSGNIEVGISAGTAAQVDASSERGSVRNSVPPQENPETSGNKVTVHARTRHGDIIIQRAAS